MRALLVLVGLALAASAFAVVILGSRGSTTMAQPEPANAMSVDAVSGGAIDASRTVTSTDPFDVDIDIQHGGSQSLDYSAYETILCFDSSVLDFVPAADLDRDGHAESWTYTDLGGLGTHLALIEGVAACPGGSSNTSLYGASVWTGGRTSASGVAATSSFRCIGSGMVTLHLVTQAEDAGFFSTTRDRNGGGLATVLADAEIICSPPPTPTACPPDVCSPTATPPPAPTPTSTPTPDPSAGPNVMSVDAVSGGTVDATRQVPTGSQFDVDIDIQHGSSSFNYAGYEASLCFDSNVLDFVPTQDMDSNTVPESWTYTDLGGLFIQGATTEHAGGQDCPMAFPDTMLYGGAVRTTGTTDASGVALTAHMACVAPGVTTLHLVTEGEVPPPSFSSGTLARGGDSLPTNTADATITCLPDTDGDKCSDRQEIIKRLDPIDPSDFYSVPVPVNADGMPNGPKDAAVTQGDVLAVLRYVGTFDGDGGVPNPNGVAYDTVKGSCLDPFTGIPQKEGRCYDRSPSPLPNPPWDAGPPSGAVSIGDVITAVHQVGMDCNGTP